MSQKNILIMSVALLLALWIGSMVVLFSGSGDATENAGVNNDGALAGQGGNGTSGPNVTGGVQDVYVRALGTGYYDKLQITVKKGIPVKFHFSAEPSSGCGRFLVMEEFNVKLTSKNGEEQIAEFTPVKEGTYNYHCGMNMFRGKMVVFS